MGELCSNCFYEKPSSGACPVCGYDPAKDEGKYPLALKPGTILNGRYIIGRVLGQGGFGVTYIAQDYQTKNRVAIKEYLPTDFVGRTQGTYAVQVYSGDRQENFEYGKEQFLAEAKTLAEFIGNDHIVRIYSYFEEFGTAYLAMEYIDGESLDNYMRRYGGRLTTEQADELLIPVMEALDWVHSKGIVHRDIAPDNIMITDDGKAKLIDFGAARYSTGEKSKSLDVILKHGFAPKEQYIRRGRQGPFTDVYAIAATYYYAITGKIPQDAIERMDEDELIPPSTLGVKINDKSEDALLKALEVSAADRYQHMGEFAAALSAARPQKKKEPVKPAEPVKPKEIIFEQPKPISEKKVQPEPEKNIQTEPERRKHTHNGLENENGIFHRIRYFFLRKPAQFGICAIFLYLLISILLGLVGESIVPNRKAPSAASSDVISEADWCLDKKTGTLTISYSGDMPDFDYTGSDIPWYEYCSEIKKVNIKSGVTKIGENAFRNCEQLTEILFSKSMTEIGSEAFKGCKSITKLDLPALLTTIGTNAFRECTSLRSVNIPKSVTCIEDAAFYGCESLTYVTFSNNTFRYYGDYVFSRCPYDDSWISSTWNEGIISSELIGSTSGMSEDANRLAAAQNIARAYGKKRYIAAGSQFTVGIKQDGTCITTGNNCPNVSDWTNIVALSANFDTVVGLRNDGTVVCAGNYLAVNEWKDIVQIDYFSVVLDGDRHVVGLLSDGTVISTGTDRYGECDVSSWTGIVDIAAGGTHTVALRSDGTVVACGDNKNGQCNVSDWSEIVDVDASRYATYGLTADGRILVAGFSKYSTCVPAVPKWDNIVAIIASNEGGNDRDFVVGICSDGTVSTNRSGYLNPGDIESFCEVQSIAVASWGYTVCVDSCGNVRQVGFDANGARVLDNWPLLMTG